MAKFICVEDDIITSILDYIPSVPESISVKEITDEEYQKIITGYYYFDIKKRKVLPYEGEQLKQLVIRDKNIENQSYLNKTDWMILRHIREKMLNQSTSLTEEEFIELEKTRQKSAKAIIN